MPTLRPLGSTTLSIPPLCFGGNVFGWTADQPTSFQLLDHLLSRGFNFIDTADVYSRWAPGHTGGESESILGQWMKQRNNRPQVLIATKVGMDMGDNNKGLRKDYILRAADASLIRLQTDYIDLYQSHKDDPNTPLDETLSAYDQLIKQGKVRHIGASNYSAPRLEESLNVSRTKNLPRYATLQPEYNLYDRPGFEQDLLPLCQRENLAVIPYFSLAAGFLTGKYRSEADISKSPRGQGIAKKYLNPRGMKILSALDQASQRTGATPAQLSFAWLLTRPTIAAPIASATNLDQLDQLLRAVDLKLDEETTTFLTTASAY
jgi:aryl-alcohol dehydrogenase-like predicted oxidoreductase